MLTKRYVQWQHQKIHSNQEERCRDKKHTHTISVQSVTDGIIRHVTSGQQYTSLILVSPRVTVIDSYHRNVMLLKLLLLYIHYTLSTSSSFSRTVEGCTAF